jgi:dephospho-CoA kinase
VRRLEELRDTDAVVVYDVPLLAETGRSGLAAVIVVDVDPEVAVQRLVRDRNMDEKDVRARIANQASREDRIAIADLIVANSGTLEDLRNRVDEVWAWILDLPA